MGSHGFRNVDHLHAGRFGHENLATAHSLERTNDEPGCVIERDPKASHAQVGDRDLPPFALREKNWDYASLASQETAASHAAKPRILLLALAVRLNKHLLHTELGRAIYIHRADRLIRAERNYAANTPGYGCVNHLLRAQDVRLDGLKRLLFAGWDLFQGGSVHDQSNVSEDFSEPLGISHISQAV